MQVDADRYFELSFCKLYPPLFIVRSSNATYCRYIYKLDTNTLKHKPYLLWGGHPAKAQTSWWEIIFTLTSRKNWVWGKRKQKLQNNSNKYTFTKIHVFLLTYPVYWIRLSAHTPTHESIYTHYIHYIYICTPCRGCALFDQSWPCTPHKLFQMGISGDAVRRRCLGPFQIRFVFTKAKKLARICSGVYPIDLRREPNFWHPLALVLEDASLRYCQCG